MTFYIKPPRTLRQAEAEDLALEVAGRLSAGLDFREVLLHGSLNGWQVFRDLMAPTVRRRELVSKTQRFYWAHEALRYGQGNFRPSPLDPYRIEVRPDMWSIRLDIDGGAGRTPNIDIFVFPPSWHTTPQIEVASALGGQYIVHSKFLGKTLRYTWDPWRFLANISGETLVFDPETERFSSVHLLEWRAGKVLVRHSDSALRST